MSAAPSLAGIRVTMGSPVPVLSVFLLLFYAVGAFGYSLVSSTLGWYIGVTGLSLMLYVLALPMIAGAAGGVAGRGVTGRTAGFGGAKGSQSPGNLLEIYGVLKTVLIALFGLVCNLIIAVQIGNAFALTSAEILFKVLLPFDVTSAVGIWTLVTSFLGGMVSLFTTIALVISSQFFIAVSETLGFQGPLLILLFYVLFAVTHNVSVAGILSAGITCLLFSWFHFIPLGTPFTDLRFAILAANGVVWAIMTLVTRSIWPAVFAHMLWNIIAFMAGGIILTGFLQLVLPVVISLVVMRIWV